MKISNRWRLMLVGICFFTCQHIQAAPFLNCTSNSSGTVDFGLVDPLQDLNYTIKGSCTFLAYVVGGGYYSQAQNYYLGQGGKFSIVKTVVGLEVPEAGGRTDVCIVNTLVGHLCTNTLSQGFRNPYEFRLTGTADATPGVHVARVEIFANPFQQNNPYPSQTVEALTISYTVVHPPCSLGSAPNLSLPFGTLTSDDFANSQRIAEIRLNCPSASLISAVLIPTQAAVSGSVGISATTLDGLSMAATWADDGTAVAFNSPRTIELTKGDNLIRLGFRPKLDTRDSPVGEFSSQYTLNLTYR